MSTRKRGTDAYTVATSLVGAHPSSVVCRGWRGGVLALVAAVLAVVSAPPAGAAPGPLAEPDVPIGLQKYVPGTPAFAGAPWMISPTCKDRGGDFSLWTAHVLRDTPRLLAHTQPGMFGPQTPQEDRARGEAIVAGYLDLAQRIDATIPAGYCVADLTRWAGAEPAIAPFGFPWGVTRDGHQTGFYCSGNSADRSGRLSAWGAERVACDGVFITCAQTQSADDHRRCAAWNAFSDEYVKQVTQLRRDAIKRHPAVVQGVAVTRTEWGAVLAAVAVLVVAGLLVLLVRRRVLRLRRSQEGGDDVRRT